MPINLPDGPTLFARLAVRLDALAEGHRMGDWLRFVARLERAQAAANLRLSAQLVVQLECAVAARSPPLAVDDHVRDAAWRDGLASLLSGVSDDMRPSATLTAIDRLRQYDVGTVEALADAYLCANVPAGEADIALFVAAALQVYFAYCAATLPVAALHLLPQRGLCRSAAPHPPPA